MKSTSAHNRRSWIRTTLSRQQQEQCRPAIELRWGLSPRPNAQGADVLAGQSDLGCNAEQGGARAGAKNAIEQFLVAVRRLNEDLRLLQPSRLFLQFPQRFFPLGLRYRQIAVKYKTLSVQAGGHK